jgi:hypothetical protein
VSLDRVARQDQRVQIEIASRFAGPPAMGHGGYVAGLLAEGAEGAVEVTLRRPIPLDRPLDLVDLDAGQRVLRDGDDLLAESRPASLAIEVPTAPSLADAAAAEERSPSHAEGRGVHPTCFGCGNRRPPGDGLRIFAGPLEVDGRPQVAGRWRPGPTFAAPDGSVPTPWVLAALDCPGAFAFITSGTPAGLLGRIVFEQYDRVAADEDHVVTGWRIGEDGRKLFAGTALSTADGQLLAAAKATWFEMPSAT